MVTGWCTPLFKFLDVGTFENSYQSCVFKFLTGTETDFFAGNRACKCLKEQYRFHMFKECFKCGQAGLKCQDDYASLKQGHWWEWRNDTHKSRYQVFIKNLLAPSPKLDVFHVEYPHPLPTPYRCPVKEACAGSLDSPCENGYQGPLCSVCSSGYCNQLKICTRCPSKAWIAGPFSIIVVISLFIVAVLKWKNRGKIMKKEERLLMDKFFSKIKIVIGFYQVTYGVLEVFSYIQWPGSLEVIANYSGFLQFNVLQIVPFQCLIPGIHAFGRLSAMMAINASVIFFSGTAHGVYKLIISSNHSLEEEEKSRRISKSKELVYKNLFFFLYVTYLSTCSMTVNVLPPACRRLCRDDKEGLCSEYLKADYSVPCQGAEYSHRLVVAYISTAYVLALPLASFLAIWRQQRKARLATQDANASNKEMFAGFLFLFENYKAHSWYWELVEMTRKVILTSGLILVGEESRSYIGFAMVIAGMYGILFAWIKPINDVMENKMMTASLGVTVFNLVIGAVSKIPGEDVANWIGTDTDALLFQILLFAANSLVIALLVGKLYLISVSFVIHLISHPSPI